MKRIFLLTILTLPFTLFASVTEWRDKTDGNKDELKVSNGQFIASSPAISYTGSPFTYNQSTAITTLTPNNTGGAVPANTYANVTTVTSSLGGQPYGLALDPSNSNLYIANKTQYKIQQLVLSSSALTTLAGTGSTGSTDASGTSASFNFPFGIAIHPTTGDIYVADQTNHKIRKITTGGVVTTFAGDGVTGNGGSTIGSSVSLSGARFGTPYGLIFDSAGNLYVLQGSGGQIRKIDAAGTTVTLIANGLATNPWCFALFGNYFYVSEISSFKIDKVSLADGTSTVFAGTGSSGSADGNGTSASFNGQRGVAVDALGNVYVADYSNNLIRRITPSGDVTTLAGTGTAVETDGVGIVASFKYPASLAVDGLGNLYVGDAGASSLRKIALTGYSITPALPAGLVFDATTGSISGTPTTTNPATVYTITAYNLSGSSATTVNIKVDGTLPVSLTKFDVAATGNGAAKLSWVTISESNNSFFKIERGENGKDFTELGKIQAAGNATAQQSYYFTDNAPLAGTNYYRLSQTDLDGTTNILGVKAFKNSLNQAELVVYPSPISGGSFSVNFAENTKAPFVVKLLSLDGKTIYKQNVVDINKSVYSFQLKNLPTPGTYILEVGNVSKKVVCL